MAVVLREQLELRPSVALQKKVGLKSLEQVIHWGDRVNQELRRLRKLEDRKCWRAWARHIRKKSHSGSSGLSKAQALVKLEAQERGYHVFFSTTTISFTLPWSTAWTLKLKAVTTFGSTHATSTSGCPCVGALPATTRQFQASCGPPVAIPAVATQPCATHVGVLPTPPRSLQLFGAQGGH